ncbi:thioester reductase domain-containing protein [Streptomyces griseoincarnatus]|uniref:Thioester reductase domain-containing protein n=1 Tax=Streptomyces griseoincarnatus TaxID=29305 RepID=A0ABT0VTJ1_STRGI|nr:MULTISPECIES: thioester reductase domain-containing protein [Streptomyces]MBJ6613342.1 thioester reductase domain-containing protein [Streptomyces sp. I3(2020)]MBJ6623691.1 thioester reductase domain-containing protein [Streptomyces sp. I4(2020)]MCM2513954.1 thioester reductase domain-containing protein [Streptomyces griseoincarnatus]
MTSTMTTEGAEEFAGDVVLADDIAGFPAPDPQTVSEVFLTGATGFLGAFLLRDLLRQGLVVHCLVRGADTAAARDRLAANLRALELLDDVDLDRVRVYTGDVTKPRLGLAEDTYAGLARRVGAVYHSAAKVNFLTLYKWLRKSTVQATHGILRFACAARATLHHVSTTGVFEPGADRPPRAELDPTGPPEALSLGYTKSKWVAEQLVLEASRRGVPVTIHRPGQVWGDSVTGACQPNDFVWRFIKGAVQVGLYPRRFRLEMNMVPVDYVSAAIVAASRLPEGTGGIYHQVSPRTLTSDEILRLLRGVGYELPEVSILKWMKAVAADLTNSMAPLLSILVESEKVEVARFADEATRDLLDGTGIVCPDIDDKVFGTYVAYFVRQGVLPAPGA